MTASNIQVRTVDARKLRWPARSGSNWAGSIAMTVFQSNVHASEIRISL